MPLYRYVDIQPGPGPPKVPLEPRGRFLSRVALRERCAIDVFELPADFKNLLLGPISLICVELQWNATCLEHNLLRYCNFTITRLLNFLRDCSFTTMGLPNLLRDSSFCIVDLYLLHPIALDL